MPDQPKLPLEAKVYTWSAAGLLRHSGHLPEIGEQLVSTDDLPAIKAASEQRAVEAERERLRELGEEHGEEAVRLDLTALDSDREGGEDA